MTVGPSHMRRTLEGRTDMADTKDTDIAPDDLDGLAGGTHGAVEEFEYGGKAGADGTHTSHLDGTHGVGGSHSK